jgi:ribosome-associated toxin RatA of RatAB toxin-antitoxin module
MPRTTLTRKVQAPQAQVLNLLLDFERYPAFVPGVLRVRAKPVASAEQKEAVEVEALLKNSKFSGTVRVHVQADRPVGRVLVSHRFGPFKTLSINFKVASVSPQSAEIRCDMEVASTVKQVAPRLRHQILAREGALRRLLLRSWEVGNMIRITIARITGLWFPHPCKVARVLPP